MSEQTIEVEFNDGESVTLTVDSSFFNRLQKRFAAHHVKFRQDEIAFTPRRNVCADLINGIIEPNAGRTYDLSKIIEGFNYEKSFTKIRICPTKDWFEEPDEYHPLTYENTHTRGNGVDAKLSIESEIMNLVNYLEIDYYHDNYSGTLFPRENMLVCRALIQN